MPRKVYTQAEKDFLKALRKKQKNFILDRNGHVHRNSFIPATNFIGPEGDFLDEPNYNDPIKRINDFIVADIKKHLVMQGFPPSKYNVQLVLDTERMTEYIDFNTLIPDDIIVEAIGQASIHDEYPLVVKTKKVKDKESGEKKDKQVHVFDQALEKKKREAKKLENAAKKLEREEKKLHAAANKVGKEKAKKEVKVKEVKKEVKKKEAVVKKEINNKIKNLNISAVASSKPGEVYRDDFIPISYFQNGAKKQVNPKAALKGSIRQKVENKNIKAMTGSTITRASLGKKPSNLPKKNVPKKKAVLSKIQKKKINIIASDNYVEPDNYVAPVQVLRRQPAKNLSLKKTAYNTSLIKPRPAAAKNTSQKKRAYNSALDVPVYKAPPKPKKVAKNSTLSIISNAVAQNSHHRGISFSKPKKSILESNAISTVKRSKPKLLK